VPARDITKILLANYEEELQAAALYSRLATREPHGRRKRILEQLADTERGHATRWASQLREVGVEPPSPERVRLPAGLDLSLRYAPLDVLIAHQEQEERQLAAGHVEPTGRVALDTLSAEIAREDAEHAATLGALLSDMGAGGEVKAGVRGLLEAHLKRETWHSQGSSWISGAVYGANDGLAAVFGIVSGTAAAFSASAHGSHIVLVAGLAGAIASALSMGCGAYLAEKSENEVHEAQVHGEKRELEEDPEGELRELQLMLQLKGLTESEAQLVAARMASDPKVMLEAMVQEEMGVGESPAGDPVRSAAAASISTGVGALFPVVPFFFMTGVAAIVTAAAVSLVAHFLVGAAKSFVTLRTWWASGLEMTVAGVIVGVATYGLGLLIKAVGG